MNRLVRLSEKERSGENNLDGVYHVVIDLSVTADKNITLADIEKKVAELGGVEDIFVEKYSSKYVAESPFNVGDTIELTAEFSCEKSVYLDTHGNLLITDKPVAESVEKVGEFSISLPLGTVAEVNARSTNGSTEVLFTGDTVYLDGLNREAYLGILEIPSKMLIKSA